MPVYHQEPMFRQNFLFCIGWDRLDVMKFVRSEFSVDFEIKPLSKGCALLIMSDTFRCILLWTANPPNSNENISIVAHEVMHAVNMMYDIVGVKHDPDNDEPFAYAVGYLMNAALESYKKDVKPKSKRAPKESKRSKVKVCK